ncbi:hypothetical protein, partial [Streptomyces pseudogriseolus]|uniref:hypothetical protein n=1 Tax=Streptomyces pseudogriseolus TaxID=36817 RepID=UPI003FA1C62C
MRPCDPTSKPWSAPCTRHRWRTGNCVSGSLPSTSAQRARTSSAKPVAVLFATLDHKDCASG